MIFFQIWRQFGTFKHKILHLLCFIIFFVGQTFFSRLIYACAKSKTRARTKHAHESKNSFNKKFLEFNFPYSDAWKICSIPQRPCLLYKANVVLVFHNVQPHLVLQSINNTNKTKEKVILIKRSYNTLSRCSLCIR